MLWESALKETGIHEYGVIAAAEIPFEAEIQKICESNVCRLYGKTWACPPAVGSVHACRERCLHYQQALVFSAIYPLTDSFDYEGMLKGHDAFKDLCDRLYGLAKAQLHDFLLLSNEGYMFCDTICSLFRSLFRK